MAKFGIRQMNHPTPQRIAILFDLLASACGIIAAWVTTAAFISHNLSDILSSVLTGLGVPLLLLFKRFYGMDLPSGAVNKEDIKVMEEQDIPKRD